MTRPTSSRLGSEPQRAPQEMRAHMLQRVAERTRAREVEAARTGVHPPRTMALVMSRRSGESDPQMFRYALERAGYRVVPIDADTLIANPDTPFIELEHDGRLTVEGSDRRRYEIDGAIVYDLEVLNRHNARFIEELHAWGIPTPAPPLPTVLAVSDKEQFAPLARKYGLPHPETDPIRSRDRTREVIRNLKPGDYWLKASNSTGGNECEMRSNEAAAEWAERYWDRVEGSPGAAEAGLVVQPDYSDVTQLANGQFMRRHLRIWTCEDGQDQYAVGLMFWCVRTGPTRASVNEPTNISKGGEAVVVFGDGTAKSWSRSPHDPAADVDGYVLRDLEPALTRAIDGSAVKWNPPDQCVKDLTKFMRANEIPYGGADITFERRPDGKLEEFRVLEINLFHAMFWSGLEQQCVGRIVDTTTNRIKAVERWAEDLFGRDVSRADIATDSSTPHGSHGGSKGRTFRTAEPLQLAFAPEPPTQRGRTGGIGPG